VESEKSLNLAGFFCCLNNLWLRNDCKQISCFYPLQRSNALSTTQNGDFGTMCRVDTSKES